MSQKLERFHKYLDEYENLVWKHVYNHVDKNWVDDITQETFIKLFEYLDVLPDEKVKPWLLVTSSNIARNYGRKGGKYKIVSIDDEEIMEYIEASMESDMHNIESILNQKAAHELLRTALLVLYEKNPIWYDVIINACMLELSSKEIGKLLNLSASNVYVIKIRARKFLHKKLGKEYLDIFN